VGKPPIAQDCATSLWGEKRCSQSCRPPRGAILLEGARRDRGRVGFRLLSPHARAALSGAVGRVLVVGIVDGRAHRRAPRNFVEVAAWAGEMSGYDI
jgi:hypothetical protein